MEHSLKLDSIVSKKEKNDITVHNIPITSQLQKCHHQFFQNQGLMGGGGLGGRLRAQFRVNVFVVKICVQLQCVNQKYRY